MPRSVALVHDWLTGMRGGEKVLEAIAGHYPEAPIYTLLHLPGSVSAELEGHPIRTSFLNRAPGVARHYRRYLPLFPVAIEDLDLSAHDLVISTSHCVAKGVIPAPDAYHLCYCHTPMRYAWDQEHAYFPRRTGLVARLRGLVLSALRTWDVASAARVDHFLANSTFVAERIERYYRREATVLPPPVDTEFFTPAKAPSRRDYLLMVSALVPYKKVEVAARAARQLGIELRVVGTGPERERLERDAGSHEGAGRVRFEGRVEGERLRDLYRGARCFVQPGIEDFGIAAVESLACGTPVVAVDRGGVRDIVDHGEHGVLYPESTKSADSLAQAVDRAAQIGFNALDLRSRAEYFSTMRFADRLTSILEELPAPARRTAA